LRKFSVRIEEVERGEEEKKTSGEGERVAMAVPLGSV